MTALRIGKVLNSSAQRAEVMAFIKRSHEKCGAQSYAAIVAMPEDKVRVLAGPDAVKLELYIRRHLPEHLAAEIISLNTLQ